MATGGQKSGNKKAGPKINKALKASLISAFRESALPGENVGFDEKACEAAAEYALKCAHSRNRGDTEILLESMAAAQNQRHLRLAIVNDDMPFLVDSVCATITAFGLTIYRLIHPIVGVKRDSDGRLQDMSPENEGGQKAESVIYIELEHTEAKQRRELVSTLKSNLDDVKAAVSDWLKLQVALGEDTDSLSDGEGSALLRWFLDRNFTLLGYEHIGRDAKSSDTLGISRMRGKPVLSSSSVKRAFKWFDDGGEAPLIIKSNHLATVHRHVLMDLIIVPVRTDGKITGLSLTSGLWTSAALATLPEKVPVLRTQMTHLFDKFEFAPASHAGKSLAHILSALPHDLLITFEQSELEKLALIAMSLLDRPRPKLHSVMSPLKRHLFAFIWLPRDQMSTVLRKNVEKLLIKATGARILNWSNSLDEGGMTSLRYTLDMGRDGKVPDVEVLDKKLENMVRGWRPAVESSLREAGQESRGAALAQRYAECFPATYRGTYGADEAANDILNLVSLERGGQKTTRLYRLETDGAGLLRLKIYHLGGALPLSDAVPTLENFGFSVLEEVPTPLDEGRLGYIHDFLLQAGSAEQVDALIGRADEIQHAITDVLEGNAENDSFNQLITATGIDAQATIWCRAWFRYLRQTGLSYGLITVVEALAEAGNVTRAMIELFRALHDPGHKEDREKSASKAKDQLEEALVAVQGIDDDRILRLFRAVIESILRTNAFAQDDSGALAFKIESAKIPDLPAPVPWREIFVYSPRVEGIHLRAGPVARGGLRWSDRRDDFRTEILGLMKAQRVKNAVIVPTGAKGGFYAKQLPGPDDRDAFIAEGIASYKIFIRSLLAITDNIVDGKVKPPANVVRRDEDDPYFVVAADKGTASFSDIANEIAVDQGFWLGDAFASGGSNGYDHKAMGITAKGAWISVQRHFLEMGVDVQKDLVSVIGVGDMSGDVFGNGMLLSKSLRLVAAFDHRDIFIDPDPDAAKSWAERKRLFELQRSSWNDYDAKLISKGGGVFSRASKTHKVSKEVHDLLGLPEGQNEFRPSELISAILHSQSDLLWFGGIGTYVKAVSENHIEVGDPANDQIRANAEGLRVKVIGEGANLGITQAGRIAFAARGGRINTDFIDNSAGVDCSDHEVNIKIALNAAMEAGKIKTPARNKLLTAMTDEVAALVLKDNRLQALGLSIAENGGVKTLPSYMRLIDQFEQQGELDRRVEGLASDEELERRTRDKRGLVRPELAVLLSTAKLSLQNAIEQSNLASDDALNSEILAAFPEEMHAKYAPFLQSHQLRTEIVATKVANRMVNRLGLIDPFELAEEEGCTLGDVSRAFVLVERLFDGMQMWHELEKADVKEEVRLLLFDKVAYVLRSHMADVIRADFSGATIADILSMLTPGISRLAETVDDLLTEESAAQAVRQSEQLVESGATQKLADMVANMYKNDGAIGIANLAQHREIDAVDVAAAFTRLGSLLGLDWAQVSATLSNPSDPWDRLLVAGLARDYQQMRLDFLRRARSKDLDQFVTSWAEKNTDRIAQFRKIISRAQRSAKPSVSMLAQIAGQARILLSR